MKVQKEPGYVASWSDETGVVCLLCLAQWWKSITLFWLGILAKCEKYFRLLY